MVFMVKLFSIVWGPIDRSRNCLFKGVATSANSCPGNPNEHRKCGKQGCAVWSEWSEWGICSATCNNGQPINRQRHRTCVIDGTNTQTTGCNGHKTETVDCPLIKGCPVWTSWGPWGECSATCGMLAVTRNRYRRCVHMGSNTSTIGCNGASIETKNCSPVLCPCDCLPEHKTPKRICGILSNGRLHFGSVCEYRQYACGYQGQIRQGSCTDPNIPDR
ncbi:properdin-like [Clytia hemisphaerica]|uniref:properdin-like n=1 Tax=Clytia hemisphaerica TaxID=252671 RepID=UPI0034D53F8F